MKTVTRMGLAALSVSYLSLSGAAFAGSIETLPMPEGAVYGEGWDIDPAGTTVVGFVGPIERGPDDIVDPHPAAWFQGALTLLDGDVVFTTPSGQEAARPMAWGIAVGVNGHGAIAGQVVVAGVGSFAALWDREAHVWRALPRPNPGAGASARGINEAGDVVGGSMGYAVVWHEGQPQLQPRLNPQDFCGAYGINDAGEVAGFCYAAASTHAVPVAWDHGNPVALWGTPENNDGAFARGLNDLGEIVGVQRGEAKLWDLSAKKVIDLAPMGTANQINNGGVAAGYAGRNGGTGAAAARATLWYPDGATQDLGLLPGGTFSWARAINDADVAVGMANSADGIVHPVVYRP